jgi:hypothetical protein
MVDRKISGSETGADQAGWRVARTLGIPDGGSMPRGSCLRRGRAPTSPTCTGCRTRRPPAIQPDPSERSGESRDGVFGTTDSRGAKTTFLACDQLAKSCVRVYTGRPTRPSDVAEWIARSRHIKVLNVAGNRESLNPGISGRAERFLGAVLRRLGHGEIRTPKGS